MKIVISPAKTLSFSPVFSQTVKNVHPPILLKETTELAQTLKQYSIEALGILMNLSHKLAKLNYNRFQNFSPDFNKSNSRPAIFTFKGDVYEGLDIDSYGESELNRLQNSLCILSGFYGLLAPFDAIKPYRLEMATKLNGSWGDGLYVFWGKKIAMQLKKRMTAETCIVNLASLEYFRAIKDYLPNRVITPIFKDEVKGKFKIISFWAKRARGLMVSYIIKENLEKVEELKNFNMEGYVFNEKGSDEKNYLFLRKYPR